jgi:hypothetical protein
MRTSVLAQKEPITSPNARRPAREGAPGGGRLLSHLPEPRSRGSDLTHGEGKAMH